LLALAANGAVIPLAGCSGPTVNPAYPVPYRVADVQSDFTAANQGAVLKVMGPCESAAGDLHPSVRVLGKIVLADGTEATVIAQTIAPTEQERLTNAAAGSVDSCDATHGAPLLTQWQKDTKTPPGDVGALNNAIINWNNKAPDEQGTATDDASSIEGQVKGWMGQLSTPDGGLVAADLNLERAKGTAQSAIARYSWLNYEYGLCHPKKPVPGNCPTLFEVQLALAERNSALTGFSIDLDNFSRAAQAAGVDFTPVFPGDINDNTANADAATEPVVLATLGQIEKDPNFAVGPQPTPAPARDRAAFL
jgi:hypothetical protein